MGRGRRLRPPLHRPRRLQRAKDSGLDTGFEVYQGPEDVFLNYVWYVDLLEVVDLNGDGLAELLFDGYAWESSGTNVVDLTIDPAEAVLRTGCGV